MSQPVRRGVKEQLAREGGGNMDEGVRKVCQEIADGATVGQLAPRYGVSRACLSWVLNRTKPEWRAWMDEAKRERAAWAAERVEDIANNVKEERGAIDKAKLQIDSLTWFAQVADRKTYGKESAPTTVVQIGELHLNALRAQPRERLEVSGGQLSRGEQVGRPALAYEGGASGGGSGSGADGGDVPGGEHAEHEVADADLQPGASRPRAEDPESRFGEGGEFLGEEGRIAPGVGGAGRGEDSGQETGGGESLEGPARAADGGLSGRLKSDAQGQVA